MTLVFDSEKKCAVCGKPSVQYDIVSTNRFGSPDLDTRPPEMERSTIDYGVQRCPHCGYCSSKIEKKFDGAEKIIEEGAYKDILEDNDFPELVNSFRCKAYINEKLNNSASVAWALIHAAWVCDDEKNKNGAKQCRVKAFEFLQKFWSEGGLMLSEKGGDYILAADLLRRSENYAQASEIITIGFDADPDDFVLELLKAEKILVDSKSDLCYTMEKASKLVIDGLQTDSSGL